MKGNPDHPSEEALFEQAIELASKAERDAFLKGACGGDVDLLDRLDRLLIAHEKAGGFMNSPTLTHAPIEGEVSEKKGAVIGRFKLLQKIGEGGMGVVYMAEQTEPVTRKVALKIIKLGMDTKQVVARFEAERQALAMMDHPNIAKVLDAGATETGRPYFAMELVRGVPITEYCDKNKLSNEERLELFIHVCQAIQHAHQKGVIHRDIKPSNVMVTLHDGHAVPKVIDFGIAKATNQKLTEKTLFTNYSHMIGTPAYMSPEQAEMSGLDVDTRTDVYSLGVLLYELLTGSTPFDTKELLSHGYGEMQRIIAEQEPPKPSRLLSTMQQAERTAIAKNRNMEVSALNKIFHGDLDWIVMKALEKDRARRYDTANGLAADIRRYQENEPIIARPPSALYKFRKAWRRNKIVYTAAALVMLSLLLGIAVSTLGLKRAVEQKTIANKERQNADEKAREASEAKRQVELSVEQLHQHLYWSLVAQAHRELESNRPSSALKLLEKCPEAFHNWEWHYLRNTCYGKSYKVFRIPEEEDVRIIISPTGRDFATIGKENVKLWHMDPRGSIHEHPRFKAQPAMNASLATIGFSSDGNLLTTSEVQMNLVDGKESTDRESWNVQLWDVGNGELVQTLKGSGAKIMAIAIDPNRKEVAAASEDDVIHVWDVTSGQQKQMFAISKPSILGLTYSHDGQWLAAATWGYVKIINTHTWKERSHTGLNLTPMGDKMLFHQGNEFFVCSDDIQIKIWNNPEGDLYRVLEGHDSWVLNMNFSSDGTRLVSSGTDRKVKLWDWENGQELLSLKGHQAAVNDVVFTADHQLISADESGEIRFWDGAQKMNLMDDQIDPLIQHTNRIWSLSFLGDNRLISCSESGNAFVWDLHQPKMPTVLSGTFDVGGSMDQKYILTAHGEDNHESEEDLNALQRPHVVRILDSQDLSEKFKGTKAKGQGGFFSAALSPDNRYLVAGGFSANQTTPAPLSVWDWQNNPEPWVLGYHDHGIMDVVFSNDGRFLASVSEDGAVKIWDGYRLAEPQGEQVIWDHTSYREFPKLAFHPDNKRLATGDGLNDVLVFDVEHFGQPPLLRLKGHGEMVGCVAYSSDGKYLASASADQTVRVWDADTGTPLHTFLGHSSIIHCISFSPDGRLLASGGQDQKIRLWRLDVLPR